MPGHNSSSPQRIRFGLYEVDGAARELRRNGTLIKLQDRPFEVLIFLLEHAGEVVTRDEFRARLWPADTFVNFDTSLNTSINKLRQALADSAENPRFIATAGRRGYRFIAPVTVVEPHPMVDDPAAETIRPPAPIPAPVEERVEPANTPRLPWRYMAVAAAVMVASLVVLAVLPEPVPKVANVTQISQDGLLDPWGRLTTDGARVFFLNRIGGHWNLMQAPASGGEAQPFSGQPQNLRITDISPDRSQLVSFAFSGRSNDLPLSLTPVVGGASRRVGEVIADDAAFMRDGRRLVFNRPDGIYESDRDGGHMVRLVALPGRSENPQWSPDGRRLRFTLHEPNSDAVSIWQVSADGGNLHRVSLNLPFIASACCGRWSLDGRYFFFTVEREGLQSIWAIRDRDAGWFRRPAKPVQLTFGPNNYGGLINDPNPGDFNPGDENSAAVSPSGGVRRERALVWSGLEEMETSRYDLGTGRLQPLLAGVHSNAMSLSPNGRFLSFATGGEIWRSNADGSDRRPLASGFAPIDDVQWSPEGSQILFHAAEAGKDGHFYAIASSGGAAVELALGNGHLEPVWHPDGKQILVAKWAMDGAASLPQSGIFLFDLKTKSSRKIVGSEGLVHPSISRDGRIVAITNFDLHPNEPTRVMLHDVQSEGWREIGRGTLMNPVKWSPDGRYFYFQDILSEGERAYRYSVATGEVGLFADFAPVLDDGYVRCMLKQIAPEGQLVVSLRRNRVNLFRLDLELP